MLLRISSLFIGVSLLASCSGGGARYLQTGGTMCAAGFAPLTLTMPKATKISIEPADGELFPSQYVYDGADIFYFNPQTDQRIYFKDQWSAKSKSFVTNTNCVSGLKPNEQLGASISAVSGLTVENSSKSTFQVREYSFSLKNNFLAKTAKDQDAAQFSTPSKVFENSITEYNFYKVSDTAYELRVKAVSPTDGAQIWLAVRYVRKPLQSDLGPGGAGGG